MVQVGGEEGAEEDGEDAEGGGVWRGRSFALGVRYEGLLGFCFFSCVCLVRCTKVEGQGHGRQQFLHRLGALGGGSRGNYIMFVQPIQDIFSELLETKKVMFNLAHTHQISTAIVPPSRPTSPELSVLGLGYEDNRDSQHYSYSRRGQDRKRTIRLCGLNSAASRMSAERLSRSARRPWKNARRSRTSHSDI